ncbi:hypothetical protein [Pseudonocardia parietis]|uniref:Uncharacterized protein n=1 Tax=Pseudonocardia parietis TaxID=570936 RepID=A0ABS4W5N1_9PSEU|nr:hypothetical protein [Pseudonocardia parietis]MBP2371521.1 hypothetical protein [Pseudonocardia parietis]
MWAAADVATLLARFEGRTVSGLASALSPPAAPLPRLIDQVIDYEPPAAPPSGGGRSLELHLRVWDGPAPEGRRVVVVLGVFSAFTYSPPERSRPASSAGPGREELVCAEIARRWLPVPPMDCVWFRYWPGDTYPLCNLMFSWPPPRGRFDWLAGAKDAVGRLPEPDGHRRPASYADLDMVVGAPVEAYPEPVYTSDTVRRFYQAGGAGHPGDSGALVDAVHDDIMLGELLGAASVLDTRIGGEAGGVGETGEDPPLGPARRADAVAACRLLADETGRRMPARSAVHDDGCGPAGAEHGRPRRWAARAVPVEPGPAERRLLQRYSDRFALALHPHPPDPAQEALLRRLWAWADATGAYADLPDPPLHAALDVAADLLGFHLRVQQGYRVRDHYQPHPVRETTTRTFTVRGPIDQAYLDGLTPLDPAPEPSRGGDAGSGLARRARVLAAALATTRADTRGGLLYGLDPHRHLVAVASPAAGFGTQCYACEWPQMPDWDDPAGLAEAVLIGDAGPDDRAVYVDWPDGRLTPLPGLPRQQALEPWSFGPHAAPAALARDIAEMFAVPGRPGPAPPRWLYAALESSEHTTRLRLPVAQLRGRCPTTSEGNQ